MPQMNKGGKFVFGESVIRPDGWVRLPPQAAEEYRIASEGKVYLFTGSKMTGGFCLSAAATSLLPWARKGRCWKRRRSWTVRYRSFEKSKACRSYGVCAAVALGMMLVGAVGMKLVPPQYFGVVERFSVFAATGFNAALGIHLFREENAGETQNDQEEKS